MKELPITFYDDPDIFTDSRLDLSLRLAVYIATFPTLERLRLHDATLTSFMALGRVIVALMNLDTRTFPEDAW